MITTTPTTYKLHNPLNFIVPYSISHVVLSLNVVMLSAVSIIEKATGLNPILISILLTVIV